MQRRVALFVLTIIFVCSSKRNPLQAIFIFPQADIVISFAICVSPLPQEGKYISLFGGICHFPLVYVVNYVVNIWSTMNSANVSL